MDPFHIKKKQRNIRIKERYLKGASVQFVISLNRPKCFPLKRRIATKICTHQNRTTFQRKADSLRVKASRMAS